MKTSGLRALVGSCAILTGLAFSSHAYAGVSNPDYYEIDISDSAITKVGGAGRMPNISGELDGDIAADGTYTYDLSAFNAAATTISGVSANWLVSASGTSGTVDPRVNLVRFTLHMKIKFSGTGVPATCQTSLFTVTVSTAKTSTQFTPHGYSSSTGAFTAVAEDFVIPQVTTTNCGTTLATSINDTFNFGAASGGVAMFMSGSITTPAIPQP